MNFIFVPLNIIALTIGVIFLLAASAVEGTGSFRLFLMMTWIMGACFTIHQLAYRQSGAKRWTTKDSPTDQDFDQRTLMVLSSLTLLMWTASASTSHKPEITLMSFGVYLLFVVCCFYKPVKCLFVPKSFTYHMTSTDRRSIRHFTLTSTICLPFLMASYVFKA